MRQEPCGLRSPSGTCCISSKAAWRGHFLDYPLSCGQAKQCTAGLPKGHKHVEKNLSCTNLDLQRMEEADAVAASQAVRAEELGRAAKATEKRLSLLAGRLDHASQWNANLEARVGTPSACRLICSAPFSAPINCLSAPLAVMTMCCHHHSCPCCHERTSYPR